MRTVIVIPIIIEFSPETFLHIMLELWIESENDIIRETQTDNNISETDNNLIEEKTALLTQALLAIIKILLPL
jgi:hypothetical protein